MVEYFVEGLVCGLDRSGGDFTRLWRPTSCFDEVAEDDECVGKHVAV